MKHKSPDARKQRRQRYKLACRPIMERLGCTSMQVAGAVQGVFIENVTLNRTVTEL